MILLIVPPLLLLCGWLLGGRPERLLTLPIRWGGLVVGVLAFQWLLVHVPASTPLALFGAVLLASHLLLLVWLIRNRHLPGIRVALVGAVLNCAVLAVNGGLMPVTPATLDAAHMPHADLVVGARLPISKDVLVTPEQATWSALGDTVVLPGPLPAVFSLGDLLLALGIGGLVLGGMRPRLWPLGPVPREQQAPPAVG